MLKATRLQQKLIELKDNYLKVIDLSELGITDADMLQIIPLLSRHYSLETLILSGNEISDTGAIGIAGFLAVHHRLRYLEMRNNAITDVGCIELGKAVSINKSLLVLNLELNADIGDLGAMELANTLAFNRTLIELYLTDTNVRTAGALALYDALENNYSLVELSLGTLNLDPAAKKKIFQRCMRNSKQCEQFLEACRTGDSSKLDTLLSHGLSPFVKDKQGDSGLHIAAAHNQIGIVRHLLSKGALPFANSTGQTPHDLASEHGYMDVAALLANRPTDQYAEATNLRELSTELKQKSLRRNQQVLSREVIAAATTDIERLHDKGIMLITGVEQRSNESLEEVKRQLTQINERLKILDELTKKLNALNIQNNQTSLHQSQNTKMQFDHINKQIAFLAMQLSESKDKEKEKTEQKSFLEELERNTNINNKIFYFTIYKKIESLFIACNAVADNLINPAGGTLGDVADVMQIVSKFMSFVPIVGTAAGLATDLVSDGMSRIDNVRQANILKSLAESIMMSDVKRVADFVAKQLLHRFQYQINLLKDPEDELQGSNIIDKISKMVFNAKQSTQAKIVAEFAMKKVLDALLNGDIQISLGIQWQILSARMVTAVCKNDIKSPLFSHTSSASKILTRDNRSWLLEYIFVKPAIKCTDGQCYAGGLADQKIYGERLGTYEEAVLLGFVPLANAVVGSYFPSTPNTNGSNSPKNSPVKPAAQTATPKAASAITAGGPLPNKPSAPFVVPTIASKQLPIIFAKQLPLKPVTKPAAKPIAAVQFEAAAKNTIATKQLPINVARIPPPIPVRPKSQGMSNSDAEIKALPKQMLFAPTAASAMIKLPPAPNLPIEKQNVRPRKPST